MAAKDWYRKYSILEAEGIRQRRTRRKKVSKEKFRRDMLRWQVERKQKEQMEVAVGE